MPVGTCENEFLIYLQSTLESSLDNSYSFA